MSTLDPTLLKKIRMATSSISDGALLALCLTAMGENDLRLLQGYEQLQELCTDGRMPDATQEALTEILWERLGTLIEERFPDQAAHRATPEQHRMILRKIGEEDGGDVFSAPLLLGPVDPYAPITALVKQQLRAQVEKTFTIVDGMGQRETEPSSEEEDLFLGQDENLP